MLKIRTMKLILEHVWGVSKYVHSKVHFSARVQLCC